MSPFEITFICIFSFIAFLLLLLVVAAVRCLFSVVHLIQKIEYKIDKVDSALHYGHSSRCGCAAGEESELEEGGIHQMLDVASQIASVAMAGMEMWKKYRKRRW